MRELLISAAVLSALFVYAWFERRRSIADLRAKNTRIERDARHAWIPPASVRGMPRRRISRAGKQPIHRVR